MVVLLLQKHDLERKRAPVREGWDMELVLVSRRLLGVMLEGEERMAW